MSFITVHQPSYTSYNSYMKKINLLKAQTRKQLFRGKSQRLHVLKPSTTVVLMKCASSYDGMKKDNDESTLTSSAYQC